MNQADATPVEFSSTGNYTTELTGADFSNLSKSDVKVTYTVFDEESYQNAPLGEEVTESTVQNPGTLQVVDSITPPPRR